MKTLHIDIETYSSTDLLTRGVYNYAEADDFQVLLFAYSVDGGAVKIVDLAMGEKLPEEIHDALLDKQVYKIAYNAQFERVCLSAMLRKMSPDGMLHNTDDYPGATEDGKYLHPGGWVCMRVLASACGFPGSLAFVGKAMGLPQNKAKMKEGARLIRLFCIPRKNGKQLLKTDPKKHLEDWETFKEYCIRDVEAEMEIQERTKLYIRGHERWWPLLCYPTDQMINDRGVKVDTEMLRNASLFISLRKEELERTAALAGVGTQTEDLKKYLGTIFNMPRGLSLTAETLPEIRARVARTYGRSVELDLVDAYIELRAVSIKKYEALKNYVSPDSILRGSYYYYGARTGRWSSRGVQIQNMPRRKMSDEATRELRQLLKDGDYDGFKQKVFKLRDKGEKVGGVMQALGQLFRTVFVPRDGHKLLTMDYKAIEPRILADLAGEAWMQECFHNKQDIYEETAKRMFKISNVDSELRQKAKVATIALGYGAGATVLESVAKNMGIKLAPGEAADLVKAWRQSCPAIVHLWDTLERATMDVVEKNGEPGAAFAEEMTTGMRFLVRDGALIVMLPTKGMIAYPNARIIGGSDVKSMDRDRALCYDGASASGKDWVTNEIYGGKLAENIVQAIARGILAETLQVLDYDKIVVMHTHDEVTLDIDPEKKDPGQLTGLFRASLLTNTYYDADTSGLCDYYSK